MLGTRYAVVHKLRPIRVAARRQWELIAIVDAGEFDDAEWVGEDHAKLTGLNIPVETVVTSGISVMDMTTHVATHGQLTKCISDF